MYILVPAAVTALLLVLGWWLAAIPFALVTAFMAFFFRDPRREPPIDPQVVVAPADGRVTRVQRVEEGNQQSPTLVSIFLSPLDVHINRAPIAGEITNVAYTRGKFLMATNQNASLVNEQNALTIRGEQITVVCKQIAGILARRIICWKQAGELVSLGERFGLIKFSSRTDILLPPQVEVLVHEGARVRGGVTVIGRIR
jgi:phosphatidylserine decarboxylase